MLEDIKKSYHECASGLGDYSSISKQKLADDYCRAVEDGDQLLKNQCFAALVLRYWYKIGRYYQESKSVFTIEDCYEWLLHALLYALEHHPWLVPGNALYGDPAGADKTINRCIVSTRLIAYQHSNTDRNKITSTATSLDTMLENIGDAVFDNPEYLEDDREEYGVNDLIRKYALKNKFFEAFVVDGICNYDVFKETETKIKKPSTSYIAIDDYGNEYTEQTEESVYKKTKYEFNTRKLVKHLSTLDNNFFLYFSKKYGIDKGIVESEAQKIVKLNGIKLNKQLASIMESFKTDKELRDSLC